METWRLQHADPTLACNCSFKWTREKPQIRSFTVCWKRYTNWPGAGDIRIDCTFFHRWFEMYSMLMLFCYSRYRNGKQTAGFGIFKLLFLINTPLPLSLDRPAGRCSYHGAGLGRYSSSSGGSSPGHKRRGSDVEGVVQIGRGGRGGRVVSSKNEFSFDFFLMLLSMC